MLNEKCPCCLERHKPRIRKGVKETNIYKGSKVSYIAEYCYCPVVGVWYANEQQMSDNFERMRKSWLIQECRKEEPMGYTGNCDNWASRLLELDELCQKIYDASGLTPETILEMFLEGYTLEAPDETKPAWNEIDRFETYD